MKSSFPIFIGVISVVLSSPAFAQMNSMLGQAPLASMGRGRSLTATTKKRSKPAPKSSTVTAEIPATKMIEPSSFDKFYARLAISYWGGLTTPNLHDMKKGNWHNAAISPQLGRTQSGDGKNQDTWAANLWSQFSFNYNFGSRMHFVINPRFMTPLAYAKNMGAGEDKSFIELEDLLVGFQGTAVASDDQKFSMWVRAGLRLSTSRPSRNSTNSGFGELTHQLDISYLPSYDFNKTWQIGVYGQFRGWIFADRYNWSRLRFYTAPFIRYTINDTTRLMLYQENMQENTKNWESINGKSPSFKNIWQTLMFGVNKDITPNFNIFPYITCYIDDTPVTDRSLFIGAWISYQIK